MNRFVHRFVRNRAAALGLLLFAAICGIAAAGPSLLPRDPFALAGSPFSPPSAAFPLGTDMLGRDVLAGLIYGARTSLSIGFTSTALALLFGSIVGGLSGYYGGVVDDLLMRFTEIFQTIPVFIFAILLVAVLGPSTISVVAAIAIVSWAPVARLVRGEFLTMKRREFVEACVGLGMSDSRIILLHVLPNCLSPIVVTGSLMVSYAILTESALAFMGLSDSNVMSWGFMIGAGREFLHRDPWLCAIPGIAILLTVLSINLIGEGLNDALNPRLRNA